MGWISKVREAARKAAGAIQKRAKKVVEAAKRAVQGKPKDVSPYREELDVDSAKVEGIMSPVEPERDYSKSKAERLNGEEKRADEEKKEEEKRTAYESFNKSHGYTSWEDYDRMWSIIGGVVNEYGGKVDSDTIIHVYYAASYKFGDNLDSDFFLNMFRYVENSFGGDDYYAEDFIDKLYSVIDMYGSKEEFYEDVQGYYV